MFLFKKKFHLVIVCSANRTRSAYFAGYLRHYISQFRPLGLRRVRITSAGTHAIDGARANDVVALIARNNGFGLRDHAAQRISAKLVRRANLFLVMEQEHKDFILEKFPAAAGKVFRVMEYGWQDDGTESLNVPDPTGKEADDFKAFIATAHAEADRLIHELIHQELV